MFFRIAIAPFSMSAIARTAAQMAANLGTIRQAFATMNPMSIFDPDVVCRVPDKLNEQVLVWKPEWAANYRQHAREHDAGVIHWDGLLLDGGSST